MKLIFLERVIELLTLVDFSRSEIRRKDRTVFLCGGQIGAGKLEPPSVREALLRYLPSRDEISGAKIILAERATEALPGSNFTNLLDLEEHIAAVVDGVILIVESAGSICELGAFVKTPEISAKLVVLISSLHNNISSFIKLGALQYFTELSSSDPEISPYHWDFNNDGVLIHGYVLQSIVEEVSESLDRVRPRGKFKISSLGDRAFLTLSICHLLRGARIAEIKDCYAALGLDRYGAEILKHLSVLEICGFLTPISHGKKFRYFVPNGGTLPLRITFKQNTPDSDRDALRWVREISALIKQHEPTRMNIFQEHQHAA